MDVIEASAIVTMAFAVGIGIQHMWDRYAANGLYRRTERRAAGIGTEIAAGVKSALIEAGREAEASMQEAMKAAETDALKAGKGLEMSLVRRAGLDKQERADATRMLIDGVVGPALTVLQTLAPDWAAKIEEVIDEDPEKALRMWDYISNTKIFQERVAPRLNAYMANLVHTEGTPPEAGSPSPSGSGWR